MRRVRTIAVRLFVLPMLIADSLRVLRRRAHRPAPAGYRVLLVLRRLRRGILGPPGRRPRATSVGVFGGDAIDLAPWHLRREAMSPLGERFHRLLHRLHSFRASAVLFVCMLTFLVATSLLLSWILGPAERSTAGPSPATILLALAGILATLTGFLLAAAVFALQYHAQQLGTFAFLSAYLLRRGGFFPLAAVSLAAIGAFMVTAIWCSAGMCCGASPWFELATLFLLLLLLLLGLYGLLTAPSQAFLEKHGIPGMVFEYECALSEIGAAGVLPSPRIRKGDLKRLRMAALEEAASGSSERFRECLTVIGALVTAWHPYRKEALRATTYYPLCLDEDLLCGQLWRSELADTVLGANNMRKVDALLSFALDGMLGSKRTFDEETLRNAGEIIVQLYRSSVHHGSRQDRASFIARRVESRILPLALTWEPSLTKPNLATLAAALGFALALLRSAMEAEQVGDAGEFLERMWGFTTDDYLRFVGSPEVPDPMDEKERQVYQLHQYAVLVIASWGLHGALKTGKENSATNAVLSKARSKLGTKQDLLELWRRFGPDPDIDMQLGIKGWRVDRQEARHGVVDLEWSGGDWVWRGFLGMLLSRPTGRPRRNLQEGLTCSLQDVERIAREWLSKKYIRRDLLGIEDGEQEEALEGVLRIFAALNRTHDAEVLRDTIQAEPADEHVRAFCEAVVARLRETPSIVHALRPEPARPGPDGADDAPQVGEAMAAASGGQDVRERPAGVIYGLHMPKPMLLAGGDAPIEQARMLAHELAEAEESEILRAVAGAVAGAEGLAVRDLTDLKDAVLRAMGLLAARQCRPSAIFVPDDSNVLYALFGGRPPRIPEFCERDSAHPPLETSGVPPSRRDAPTASVREEEQVPSQDLISKAELSALHAPVDRGAEQGSGLPFGPRYLGDYERCRVFAWPEDVGADDLVVVDAERFFSWIVPADRPHIRIDIQDHNRELHERWLAEMRHDESAPHTPEEVEVLAVARLAVRVAVADPLAAVRVDLP